MLLMRKARMRDIPEMLALINGYAAQGTMLPRTDFELAEDVRDFVVAESGGAIVGCGALHIYTPSAAEVRSLAVDPHQKALGIGRKVVEELDREAAAYGLTSLFAFTYVPGFFAKLGYTQVERGLLPQKAWKDCLRCPKFQNCDEIAVHKELPATEATWTAGTRPFNVLPTSGVHLPPIAGMPVNSYSKKA
jgi:amino-acid N-acetyltransferase